MYKETIINSDSKKYIDWEICNFGKALDYWVYKLSQKKDYTSALELGAGDGDISIFLSDLNYSNIYCTDLNTIRKNKIINSGYKKIKYRRWSRRYYLN